MAIPCLQPQSKMPNSLISATSSLGSFSFLQIPQKITNPSGISKYFKSYRETRLTAGAGKPRRRANTIACGWLLLVDPWAPNIDSQSIASQLFAFSLFPYLGFLYFITKSKSAPKLTLFGFYFLLAFVGATTKVKYGTSLSNVDWLHGGAESLLTLTNLFIVLGLRNALRKGKDTK